MIIIESAPQPTYLESRFAWLPKRVKSRWLWLSKFTVLRLGYKDHPVSIRIWISAPDHGVKQQLVVLRGCPDSKRVGKLKVSVDDFMIVRIKYKKEVLSEYSIQYLTQQKIVE